MPGPDRVPVLDALGVVPHPVAVDQVAAGLARDAEHQAVDVGRNTGEHPGGRGAEAGGPGLADQVVVPADAARGHDDRLGPQFEGSGRLARAGDAPFDVAGHQDLAGDGVGDAVVRGQAGDAVAEADVDQAPGHGRLHPAGEGLDDAGAGAPGDVEARHRVAGAGGEQSAALGPPDDGEEADALGVQPGALLAGGEVDVGLGPAARPGVLVPVETGRALPVLPGQFVGVAHPHPALLGRVDQEEAAEGPVRLAAEGGRRLLVEQDDLPSGVRQFRGGDQAGQAGSDDDDVGVECHAGVLQGRRCRWVGPGWVRYCGLSITQSTGR